MKAEEIIEMIKTNSEIDFIKDDVRINIRRIFLNISVGHIFINENDIFGFSFDDLTKYEHDEIIYFSRSRRIVFSWYTKGFKLVPKEI